MVGNAAMAFAALLDPRCSLAYSLRASVATLQGLGRMALSRQPSSRHSSRTLWRGLFAEHGFAAVLSASSYHAVGRVR
jgi:hypothetical protein